MSTFDYGSRSLCILYSDSARVFTVGKLQNALLQSARHHNAFALDGVGDVAVITNVTVGACKCGAPCVLLNGCQ